MKAVLWYTITVILTMELVMADDDQCTDFQFKSPFLPGESCEGICNKNPESHTKPGYYWILSREYCGMTYTGSSCEDIFSNNPETGDKSGYYKINDKWTYCDMNKIAVSDPDIIFSCAGVEGRWRKIANIDISAGDECPSGWRKYTYSGISFCRVVSDNNYACSSANFSTSGTSYQKVCGRARGYQKGQSASFWGYYNSRRTIDGEYVEGLSLTYGNPRQHIWTYANGRYDNRQAGAFNCPCAVGGGPAPPPFVGTNYYCESGAANTLTTQAYYFDDPLWDGSGCITSNCCTNLTQPWFYYELNKPSTSDIEARICRVDGFSVGSTLIDQLELYVQ